MSLQRRKIIFSLFFRKLKILFFSKIVPLPHYFRLVKKPEKTSQETITSPSKTATIMPQKTTEKLLQYDNQA